MNATEALAEKLLQAMNHTGMLLMISVGHRTGLFDTLAGQPPLSSAAIAQAANLNERYVREWLGGLVTAGLIDYDPATQHYQLPAAHAAILTRAAAPNNMASLAQWVAVLGSVEDSVADAFRHGAGVPYCAYHRFHEVMAEESEQTTVAALDDHILPLLDGMQERLRAGIDMLDVGCGSGRALLALARAYPQSRFVGLDMADETLATARQIAHERGLTNVTFEVRDAAALGAHRAFDLVTAFDAIHDQAAPAAVLRNVAEALRPGGVFLMQDIAASSRLEANRYHPLGTFLYTISCFHCMSVALVNGGAGLGAVWGKELALTMLREAGFGRVRVERLPHDILNYYYIAAA